MNLAELYKILPRNDWHMLAIKCETSTAYLDLLRYGTRKVGPKLAKKLVQIDSRLTLAALRPDIWGDPDVVKLLELEQQIKALKEAKRVPAEAIISA